MLTPYDWQEGIGNRAQYVEAKLAQGAPVVAVSLQAGILVFTYRKGARKIFEVYDRLIFGAVGQQSDIEALRMAAVDFAHQEGYNRSEEDVTIQRVATALSAPLKKAFGDFGVAPLVARSLFGEVGPSVEEDRYYVLDYDGDFRVSRRSAVAAGDQAAADRLVEQLGDVKASSKIETVLEQLKEFCKSAYAGQDQLLDPAEGASPEAVLLSRASDRVDRFRVLLREEI
ncbi:MAG: 20S proteasome subunit A/B [Fimbriimonas ginsengisoli]|nr:20S proteasome subunit A/B [Fimbriimonas ginsengisoli]